MKHYLEIRLQPIRNSNQMAPLTCWNEGNALSWGDSVLIPTEDNSGQYTRLGQPCNKMNMCVVNAVLITNVQF